MTASRSGFGIPLRFVFAVCREPEHRFDQLLELERRPHLADEVRFVVASVPELVSRPGRNGHTLTRTHDDLLRTEPEAEGPAQDLEPLLLVRMNVGGRDEAVRLDEGLEHDRLAVRLAGGLPEDEPLAGDRVLDDVA